MAKGQIAKDRVVEKIQQAIGTDWIGKYDNKYYCWSSEDGERVQVAISLTCPKTPVEFAVGVDTSGGDWDFSDETKIDVNAPAAVVNAPAAELTQEEEDTIAALMARCGL